MREEVKRWIDKAEKDLNTAKYNFRGNIFDASIFYSQQSVEKALKALLLKNSGKFPKIHDLTKLARLAKTPEKIIKLCSKVNPGYLISRYPDQEGDYSDQDCKDIMIVNIL